MTKCKKVLAPKTFDIVLYEKWLTFELMILKVIFIIISHWLIV